MERQAVRLGLLAYSTNTGLGAQTAEYYQHLKPAKTLVVDISKLNGMKQYPERYPDGIFVKGFPQINDIDNFLKDLDVILVAETPLNYDLIRRANELGVASIMACNFEFMDYLNRPDLPKPTLLTLPSMWRIDETDAQYLPFPVNRKVLPYQNKVSARRFYHSAGKPAVHDRNGTDSVLDCLSHVKSDISLTIHVQSKDGVAYYRQHKNATDKRIHWLVEDYTNYWEHKWANYDVMLLPRRYGGQSLILNEALASGLPVIMTDISPNFTMLPNEWLVESTKIGDFMTRTTIDIYEANAIKLGQKIDWLYNMKSISTHSQQADRIAYKLSWETLINQYREAIEWAITNRP